jgi:hypothetical protein
MTRQAASGQLLCTFLNNNLLFSVSNSFLNSRNCRFPFICNVRFTPTPPTVPKKSMDLERHRVDIRKVVTHYTVYVNDHGFTNTAKWDRTHFHCVGLVQLALILECLGSSNFPFQYYHLRTSELAARGLVHWRTV